MTTPGGIVSGTVVSAVIGGTTSELSSGKFANGASTAAFQFLFNAEETKLVQAYQNMANQYQAQQAQEQAETQNQKHLDLPLTQCLLS